MKLDKSIILLIVVTLLILSYFVFFYSDIKFELKSELIEVNLHETVDLYQYVSKVKDGNNKNLITKLKISVDGGSLDKLSNHELYIGDVSNKTITYTLKYKFKTYTKTLDITVITDPNNPNFKPNYSADGVENTDDVPNHSVDKNLNAAQRNYLNSLK